MNGIFDNGNWVIWLPMQINTDFSEDVVSNVVGWVTGDELFFPGRCYTDP